MVAALALAVAALAGTGRAGAAPARLAAPAGTISTVIGGVGGPGRATGVSLYNVAEGAVSDSPCGLSQAAGQLYIADGGAVRRVSQQTGWLTTPAGLGLGQFQASGATGPAAEAALNDACGVVRDAAGNLVVADTGDSLIVAVAVHTGTFYGQAMTAGNVYVVAGDGGPIGFSGDGGPATSAQLYDPAGVTIDAAGNLVIADTNNNRIRVVAVRSGTFYGQAVTAGHIYTVAGGGTAVPGDGGPARKAELDGPYHVAVDAAGNLVIADQFSERIQVVADRAGTFYGQAMAAGHIYTVAGDGTQGVTGDGGPATQAELYYPEGVALDGAGNLVIAEAGSNRVRVVAHRTGSFYGQAMTAGHIYTVAGTGVPGFTGNGGAATAAQLNGPQDVTVDAAGNLVIADTANGQVRVVAAATARCYGRDMTAGDIYTVAGTDTGAYSGNRVPATAAEFNAPQGVAVAPGGNVAVADTGDSRVRVVAHTTGTFYGQPMTAGDIYTVAGGGTSLGSGGPGTRASLDEPTDVTADAAGNLVIADRNNSLIRVVADRGGRFYGRAMTAGDIYTIAGTGFAGFSGDGGPAVMADLEFPGGVTVDGAGNVLIADTRNNMIRVVAAGTGTFYGQPMTAGDISTIAGGGSGGDGGPATAAMLLQPGDITLDGSGNLVIADTEDDTIRAVAASTGRFYGQAMTAGDVYTIAGNGAVGGQGDGGPALRAQLGWPMSVVADRTGNLLIATVLDNRIRVVAHKTGTFYGVAMTAGDVYTVAGGHGSGFTGDGGPGSAAGIDAASGVALDDSGNLLIADTGSNRIREVLGP